MKAKDAFDKLAEALSKSGVTKSNMFGMPVLKLGKKPIAGLVDDGINFKLPADGKHSQEALELDGAHLFQPEMHGKKGPLMKQWVVVPFSYEPKYMELVEASIKLVEQELNKKF